MSSSNAMDASVGGKGPRVWLITGCSSGLGYHLVRHVLSSPTDGTKGDLVIATARARSIHLLHPLLSVPEWEGRLKLVELDVADTKERVTKAVDEAFAAWGRIDVLVNNAGFGQLSTLEEGGVETLMNTFNTNVFGQVKVTNTVIPHMRATGEGMILFIGSRSGWKTGLPLLGLYSSSKAALHAIIDTYATELAHFGIKVIGVHPGGFRTNAVRTEEYNKKLETKESITAGLGSEASVALEGPKAEMGKLATRVFQPNSPDYTPPADRPDAYKDLNEMAGKYLLSRAGMEQGDPEKAADVMIELVRGTGPFALGPLPRWVPLGSDCITDIRAKCTSVLEDINKLEAVSVSTDFDA